MMRREPLTGVALAVAADPHMPADSSGDTVN
jgi:hypothetical protein